MGKTRLPIYVSKALECLEHAGHEAYVVGGCVRDTLLGVVPTDFDITTSATPDEIKAVFASERTIDFGIKHGTVGIVFAEGTVEITTFRLDGEYRDARHPSCVSFTTSLEEDLMRRDFTINAMAYSPKRGLVDPFGGQADLRRRLIRCVGNPQKRFSEDALRIMRALRFSSALGFEIEEETKTAAIEMRGGLKSIANERISAEFLKTLCGKNVRPVIMEMIDVIGTFIPDALCMKGFSQRNPHHIYDVLEHTAVALENIEPNPEYRLAVFLHDIGKPKTFSLDSNGVGHFKGHAKESHKIATEVLARLRLERSLVTRVLLLVEWHDLWIEPQKKCVKRVLTRLTPDGLKALLAVKRADNLAQHPDYHNRLSVYDQIEKIAEEIIEEDACFMLKDLAINGDDLLSLGFSPGRRIGEALTLLLDGVIEERFANEREVLLEEAKKLI